LEEISGTWLDSGPGTDVMHFTIEGDW
jgi:hypothetical protein